MISSEPEILAEPFAAPTIELKVLDERMEAYLPAYATPGSAG
ncbi:MAG: hypothetical protein JWQ11_4023, partial [Rhizobacter sp.]|nr:hypothetical protein [Rhizobacter sp.]